MPAPLENIRAIELATAPAGAFAGRSLAIMGAEVVKIESPGIGDPSRRRGPFLRGEAGPDASASFLYLNAGKLGITLDMGCSTGRDVLRRLFDAVDIALFDVPPATLDTLGLSYDLLSRSNPRLSVVCLSPFGLTGPYRDFRAYELNVFQSGGEGFLLPNGLAWEEAPDRPPLKPGGCVAEYVAGVSAAIAALAALHARDELGRGQLVDCSKQETQLSLNHVAIQRYVDGVLETRANRSFAYGGVIPCKDGYVELLTIEQHQWEALVRFLGKPEWTRDERFQDAVSRGRHGREINAHLRAWAHDHCKEWLFREGQAAGVPIVPYRTPEEILKSPQERERGFFVEIDHPVAGPLPYPSWPFRFSESQPAFARPAPTLGQHNGLIYGEWLGYGRQAVGELFQAGVI